MRRIRTLLFFGIWIAVLPYLGFPFFWKNILFTLSGLLLVLFACILYKEYKTRTLNDKKFENFSENRDFNPSLNEENY